MVVNILRIPFIVMHKVIVVRVIFALSVFGQKVLKMDNPTVTPAFYNIKPFHQ